MTSQTQEKISQLRALLIQMKISDGEGWNKSSWISYQDAEMECEYLDDGEEPAYPFDDDWLDAFEIKEVFESIEDILKDVGLDGSVLRVQRGKVGEVIDVNYEFTEAVTGHIFALSTEISIIEERLRGLAGLRRDIAQLGALDLVEPDPRQLVLV